MEYSDISNFLLNTYNIKGQLSRLDGENENYLIVVPGGKKYVLKVADADEKLGVLLIEHHIAEKLMASELDVSCPAFVRSHDGRVVLPLERAGEPTRLARLLTFVHGEPWNSEVPAFGTCLIQAGELIAELGLSLQSLQLQDAKRTHHWDLTQAGELSGHIRFVDNKKQRAMLERAFVLWKSYAQDLENVPRGLIHGDLNDDNLLISSDKIVGVLDFGDALENPLVCDLAIALAYLLLDEPDPWQAGATIVASYHGVRPLSVEELELLYPLVCARLAVSIVTSAQRRQIDPERKAWFVTEQRAWVLIERLMRVSPVVAAQRFGDKIPLTPYPDAKASTADLLRQRKQSCSDAMSLSYEQPLRFIRGRGAYLIDASGTPYLDLYNNVCHVGHCHPRVVEAGQRQMAKLNTNTRYLTDEHIQYTERLKATLPPSLTTIFLVNSGTEANELALRLARAYTGRKDLVVVDNAYHGHSTTMIDASPYKFMGHGGSGECEPWVHTAPVPDVYRDPLRRTGRDAGIAYADELKRRLQMFGTPLAAFLAESLLSCGGQIVPPPGYFERVFEHVRASGGVCILDEVQVGFGRVGSHFWAFEAHGVTPDIVVMGKPMGNGFPLSAVACTQEISDAFAESGMEYFATFGGNSVSCAVGLAVLDVIEEEQLQARALTLGKYFMGRLLELKERYPCIGDVRGAGLFIGIEFVEDQSTLAPATALARRVVNGWCDAHILAGTDGPYNNVVKIKPPLVLTEPDVDRAITSLGAILAQLY